MSLAARLLGQGGEQRGLENPSTPLTASELASALGMSYRTSSGIVVNQDTALRHITVTACQRLIAETISTLPLGMYVKNGSRVEQLPLPRFLEQPNPDLEGPELVEDLVYALLGDGNSCSQIIRDRRDDVIELYPIPTSAIDIRRDSTREPIRYTWVDIDGRQHLDYGPSGRDILHIRAFRRPGTIRGMSPIEKHRQAIGLGLATEEFGATFFGNGAMAGGHLETPNKLSREAAQILIDTWVREHGGLGRAHRPGMLTEGLTWKQTQIQPDHAQFLDTQKFNVAQIARMYRVPPHLVGDVERSTSWGTGIEEQNIAFLRFTLLCWIVRVERALTKLVRPTGSSDGPYIKLNVSSLLRGSLEERYKAYAIGRQWGWESPNSVLTMEEREPIAGGDSFLVPLTHIDVEDIHVRPGRDRAQGFYYFGQAKVPADVAAQLMGVELTTEQLAAIDQLTEEMALAAAAAKPKGIPRDGTEPTDPTEDPDDSAAAGDEALLDPDTDPDDDVDEKKQQAEKQRASRARQLELQQLAASLYREDLDDRRLVR